VSSLLVTLIPGLLMAATFGLQRLEAMLACDTVSAADVAEFLQQAQADDVHTLARDGMPMALDGLHRRLQGRLPDADGARPRIAEDEWSNLPTPVYLHDEANTEFQPSRHAYRV
jgi:hypothetical protein